MSTGPFRKEYRKLLPIEVDQLNTLKTDAEELYKSFSPNPNHPSPDYNRQMALARTKLEESVMWGTKAITG